MRKSEVSVDPRTAAKNESGEDKSLPMRDFAHSLPMALLSTRELVMSQFRPMLREYGVTEQQWRVIRALVETAEVEVTELAKRSYILSPSLSRILQNLEARGLINRNAVQSDQRRALISISTKGRQLFDTIAPHSEAHYAKIAAAFGENKLTQLYTLLGELNASLAGDFQ
jgi:homoprotocatechuate degradation regulator HpaR